MDLIAFLGMITVALGIFVYFENKQDKKDAAEKAKLKQN
jgi:cadmium resistance protein CadD (predicted permease)